DPKIHYPKFNELLVQNTKPAPISLRKGRLRSYLAAFFIRCALHRTPKDGSSGQKAARFFESESLG
ncbi:MAG TPA: hypothetical protein PK971_13555, partial [Saprospiraceae bacterium]|nr:hypothetical protein [Saprospiraceae bacterium]